MTKEQRYFDRTPMGQLKQCEEMTMVKYGKCINIDKIIALLKNNYEISLKLLGHQFISVKYVCYLCLMFRCRVPKSGCGKLPFHRIPGDKGRRKDSTRKFPFKNTKAMGAKSIHHYLNDTM